MTPANNATVPINVAQTIQANATANTSGASIVSVQFFQGNVAIGTVTTAPYIVSWTPTTVGPFSITAVATDSTGASATSSPLAIFTPTAAPTIVAGSFNPPTTIPVNIPVALTADARATNANILTVEYFLDGVFINSATTYPYLVQWPGSASLGSHVLSAVATDTNGSKSLPATKNIVVGPGTSSLSIAITAPTSGSTFRAGESLTLSAVAQLGSGIASSVVFYANGVALIQSPNFVGTNQTSATLTATFAPAAYGTYVFTAIITDTSGNRAISPDVTVTVTPQNQPPAVAITNPLNNANLAIGTPINFAANVTDSDGTVAQVQFFDGDTLIGTKVLPPFSVPWSPSGAAHTLKVIATDDLGAQTTATVAVTVGSGGAGNAPTVAITSPTSGSAIPVNTSQTVTATATAKVGTIAKVEFYANGVSLGSGAQFPYTATWLPKALGSYSLVAVATDTVGNQAFSPAVTVTVNDPSSIPSVAITAPAPGATIGSPTTLTATASSPNGAISSVQFYANGLSIGVGAFSASHNDYEFSWSPGTAGIYTVTAVATDVLNVMTTSAPVPVNYIVGSVPTISITSPSNGTTLLVGSVQTITATATSTTGSISSVQFAVDGVALSGQSVSGSQYSSPWTVTIGTHQITAIAKDNAGNVGLSTVTVQGTNGPLISVSSLALESTSATPGSQVSIDVGMLNSAFTDVITHTQTGDTVHTPTATAENQWNVGGTATFNVTYFDPTNAAVFFTQNGLVGTVTKAIPGLGGNGTIKLDTSIPWSTTPAGHYKITVTLVGVTGNGAGIADPLSTTTPEASFAVTGKPDLAITGLTYPTGTTYKGGDVIPMSLTYANLRAAPDGTGNVPYQPGVNSNANFFRIEVILSTNPTFGDADDFQLTFFNVANRIDADGVNHTINWSQLLPGNFAGTYYVMAKIDTLSGVDEAVESDLTQNGNNVWSGETGAARITLQPTNFPTVYWASLNSNGYSDNPAMSGSGRYVAFASDASNLVAANSTGGTDTNGVRDIFLYDNNTQTIKRINLSAQSVQANGPSNNPAISSDGRFVAFSSDATNLVANDTNGFSDIFVVDTVTGAITRDSVSSTGLQANGSNFRPALSGDGRYVVWESTATNLVGSPSVAPGHTQIYLRDRTTGTTVLISESSAGAAGNGDSTQAVVSGDGKLVAFASEASNLVMSSNNGVRQIYLRDLTASATLSTGITTMVSVDSSGTPGNHPSQSPSISRNLGVSSTDSTNIVADGRYIAFDSLADNLVAADANGVSDIFVYDRFAQTTRRVSVSSAGTEGHDPSVAGKQLGSVNPSINATGRYVTFASLDADLAGGDSAGEYEGGGATATATVTGGTITGIAVTASGAKYSQDTPPEVIISDVSGTGARAMANVNAAGAITSITVISGGSGYSANAKVSIASDANDAVDIFVADRDVSNSGTYDTATNIATTLVSVNRFGYQTIGLLGTPSTAASDLNPVISDDGRWVAMPSDAEGVGGLINGATNRTSPDSNGFRDVFLYDRRTNSVGSSNAGFTLITAPLGPVALPQGSSVILKAGTSGALGAIQQVQYYDNGSILGSPVAIAPYSLVYQPRGAVGSVHTITAQATDYSGTPLSMSSPVTISVIQAVAPLPVVSISNPATGFKVLIPAYGTDAAAFIPVTVTVDTSLGQRIQKVELYADGNLLVDKTSGAVTGVGTVPPYTFHWQPTAAGTYQLVALAYDNNNNVIATAPVTSIVCVPPTVMITSPLNNASVANGSSTNATMSFATSNGYPVTVGLYFDGKFIGEKTIQNAAGAGPVTISYTPVQKKSSDGTVQPSTLYAAVSDGAGFSAQSTPITLNVTDGGGGGTGSGTAPTVNITYPNPHPDPANPNVYVIGSSVTLSATAIANDAGASIAQVVFSVNGQTVATLTKYPYNTDAWTPTSLGDYVITAKATDTNGNAATSDPVNVTINDLSQGTTKVTITPPATGSTFTVGAPITLRATASDYYSISSVEFLINGQSVAGGKITAAPYNFTWTPASAGTYTITARATNGVGNEKISDPIQITVNSNHPPAVALTAPSAAVTLPNGTSVSLSANASDVDGTVTSVVFLANGIQIGSVSSAPYTASWLPTAAGTYNVIARATDNSGNVTDSAAVAVTVQSNLAPSVSITSPATGSTVRVNSAATITVDATDPDGSIANVQFYVNGSLLGSVTSTPFTETWTPTAEGVYRLTAVATDNAGATTTSSTVFVAAAATSLDGIATGIYLDITTNQTGNFTAINLHGRAATFIGYVPASSTTQPARTYFFDNAPVDSASQFELDNGAGVAQILGEFSASGADGYFLDGANKISFSGPLFVSQSSSTVAAGSYSGSVTGHYGSVLSGIVSPDGHITLYVQDGTLADSGATSLSGTGAFTLTTRAGNKLVGIASPATGLLTGTLTKADGTSVGSFTGAQASGTTFSDGTLRNISSRGYVGTGDQVMIAGFVVDGTNRKNILLRAIGPTLISQGLAAGEVLADPVIEVHDALNHNVIVASNDNWGDNANAAAIVTTAAQVGAAALSSGDATSAALLVNLRPGIYTALVSGKAGSKGVALVEMYDVDTVPAYGTEKMVNISTRGEVSTGSGILIGGFVVNGSSPKKVLVRGVGPGLTAQGMPSAGLLADPVLQIQRFDPASRTWSVVRENDNWEVGNDATLVSDAAAQTGATPLAAGSTDAAILMNLPPGIYTAQLSGKGSTTGIGLIEVYEVQ